MLARAPSLPATQSGDNASIGSRQPTNQLEGVYHAEKIGFDDENEIRLQTSHANVYQES
jgi:hypothetical protein